MVMDLLFVIFYSIIGLNEEIGRMGMEYKNQKGFTLIELSIVVVVIALIVAGVVAGQSLVDASKKRSLITELNTLKANVVTFKLIYSALPGDMPNASDFWSGVTNGTGDGKVNPYSPANLENNLVPEDFLFGQHLTLAGLSTNNVYNLGATSSNALSAVGKELIESTSYSDVIYLFESDLGGEALFSANRRYLKKNNGQHHFFVGTYDDDFYINATYYSPVVYPLFTLSDMMQFEEKIDDGNRLTGIINGASVYVAFVDDADHPHPGDSAKCSPYDDTSNYYTDNIDTRWCIFIYKAI